MPEWLKHTWETVKPHAPSVGAALAILIIGWLVALLLRRMTFAALKRTTWDDKIAEKLGFQTDASTSDRVEKVASSTVYYIVLALVFVAFFDRLEVDSVTKPIVGALEGVLSAVPNVMKAVIIGAVGFVAATVARKLVRAGLVKTKLVNKLERMSGEEDAKAVKKRATATADTISTIVFWAILGVAAIPVLEALKIGALSAPLSATFEAISTYLPKIVGAIVLALTGYVLGRLARAVITRAFSGLGIDRALERLGLARFLGERSAGSIIGSLAFAFIMLNFAISAVGRLDIKELSGPLGVMLQQVYDFLPKLLVAGLLMAVGVVLARIASRFASNVLAAVGFNALMGHIGLFNETEESKEQQQKSKELLATRLEGGAQEDEAADSEDESEESEAEPDALIASEQTLKTPADIAGVVVGAFVVLLFLRQVLGTLKLTGLAALLDTFIGYLPNVLSAAVVLGAAMWAGAWAHARIDGLTEKSKDTLLRALGMVAHVAIVAVGAMVSLQQLGVGEDLITTAFALLLGAVCLAIALAFGLGGREVASKILNTEYEKRRRR